jgi:hypothetical protein
MMDDEWTLGGTLDSMRSGLADWRNETFGPLRTAVSDWRNKTFGKPMGDIGDQSKYGRDDDPAAEVRAAMAREPDPAKREAIRRSFSLAQRRPSFNPTPPPLPQVAQAMGATMGGPMGFQGSYDPYQQRRLV